MTNQEICLYSFSCNPLYRFRLTGPCHPMSGCAVTSALENRSSFPLFNGNHRQEGKESTRNASGTRMPPPSGRNRHRFVLRATRGERSLTGPTLRHKRNPDSTLRDLPFITGGQSSMPHGLQENMRSQRGFTVQGQTPPLLCASPVVWQLRQREHTAVRLVPKPSSGQPGTFIMQVKSLGQPFRPSESGIPMSGMAHRYITHSSHSIILVRTGTFGTSISWMPVPSVSLNIAAVSLFHGQY